MVLGSQQRYVSEYLTTKPMDPNGTFIAELIEASPRAFAAGALARQRAEAENLPEGLLADTEMRLRYLAAALATGRAQLFHDHVGWIKIAYHARSVPLVLLEGNLRCLADELEESLPEDHGAMARRYLEGALRYLGDAPAEMPTLLDSDAPHADLAANYLLAVMEMRQHDALEMLLSARTAGVSVNDLYTQVVRRAQQEIGRLWQVGDITTGEEHYASRVAEFVMGQLAAGNPRATSNGRRVVLTSVSGDLHEIAVRMVGSEFEQAGWETVLLGANTPSEDVVHMLKVLGADLLAVSASLAIHVRALARLIEDVRKVGTSDRKLPILVGGAPFQLVPDLWQVVGADATANDAVAAVSEGNRLVDLAGR